MSKNTKIIFISLAVVLCAAIVIILLLRPKHITENINPQGTMITVLDSAKNHIEAVWCKKCHVTIDSITRTGTHNSLNCQLCHGPAFKHTRNPYKYSLHINSSKGFCLKCHDISNVAASKPKNQIDSLKHNSGSNSCIICHNPHSPLMAAAISRSGETQQVAGASCTICHKDINKTLLKGTHKTIGCQSCHGQGDKHVLSPSPKNINKPQSREFCAKCHATVKSADKIKQIDLKEHNDGMNCVECHLAHNPLEFK